MNKIATKNYEEWKSHKLKDPALIKELDDIKDDEAKIEDRFYKDLEFGTAGLRGILGVGTNRMNIYTVAKATYGFAQYILDQSKQMDTIASVAIAYDSRINSDIFAKIAATVMASMGVVVYIWQELMPTPALSYAVRYYHTTGGIVITASHNPSQYNGYKVYGPDGCQITTQGASSISSLIDKIDIFDMDDTYTYEQGIKDDKIIMISDKCFDSFISDISDQSLYKDSKNKDIKIIYTPLYGTGLRCITTCFRHNGFTNIELVEEQAVPDGHFPTCPYPNPEIKEALELGLKAARNKDADILIATDPDCDRVGIAVKDSDDYRLITGNEVGLLLLDYICKRRIELGQMPKSPVCIKSIVTTDLAIKIADDYGVQIIDVLTGFKYIGEQIAYLESKGEEDRFILGFEESYGYLTGTYVRDKDAIDGSLMIADMCAYYKSHGRSLLDILDEIYKKYGYCLNVVHSYEFDGESGLDKMDAIMEGLRNDKSDTFAERKIISISDFQSSKRKNADGTIDMINLPKSNVIKYVLEGDSSIVARPSGTEPKLKLYVSICADSRQKAEELDDMIKAEFENRLRSI